MDSIREKKIFHISSKNRDTTRRMRRGRREKRVEGGKNEKRAAPAMQASFRTAKPIFFPCFVTENPSEHNQTVKRAFVVSNKTFENALWLADSGAVGMVEQRQRQQQQLV